jgi:hypothetical protein
LAVARLTEAWIDSISTSQRQPGTGVSLQFRTNDVLAEAPRVDTVVLIIQYRLSPNDLSLGCEKTSQENVYSGPIAMVTMRAAWDEQRRNPR